MPVSPLSRRWVNFFAVEILGFGGAASPTFTSPGVLVLPMEIGSTVDEVLQFLDERKATAAVARRSSTPELSPPEERKIKIKDHARKATMVMKLLCSFNSR